MDLIRSLLGDEKLNYIGYSYGTWLGAWYAGLYPERVGRMVLDSVWPLSDAMETRLFDLLPYAARHASYFGLGTSAAGIQAQIDQLDWRVQHALALLGRAIYSRHDSDDYVAMIKAGSWLDAALKAAKQTAPPGLPPAQRNAAIEHAMEQAMAQTAESKNFVPGPSTANALVQTQVDVLGKKSGHLWLTPAQPKSYMGREGFWTVSCNDDVSDTSLPAWSSRLQQATLDAPLFAGVLLDDACLFWSRPNAQKPAMERLQELPILLIQDEYDGATPAPAHCGCLTCCPRRNSSTCRANTTTRSSLTWTITWTWPPHATCWVKIWENGKPTALRSRSSRTSRCCRSPARPLPLQPILTLSKPNA